MGRTTTEVYWDTLIHPIFPFRPLHLAATAKGLCLITLPNESFDTLQEWVDKKIPQAALIRDPLRMSEYVRQLREYLEGDRREFTCSFDLRGTAFQVSVWQALARIPYGQVWSYSDIAETVGSPNAVRAVGAANGANPIPIIIPCHRVLGKNTALTGYRGGLQVKETLLRLEGVGDYLRKGHLRFQF